MNNIVRRWAMVLLIVATSVSANANPALAGPTWSPLDNVYYFISRVCQDGLRMAVQDFRPASRVEPQREIELIQYNHTPDDDAGYNELVMWKEEYWSPITTDTINLVEVDDHYGTHYEGIKTFLWDDLLPVGTVVFEEVLADHNYENMNVQLNDLTTVQDCYFRPPTSPLPTVYTFEPTDDAFVQDNWRSGYNKVLRVSESKNRRSYLKFEVSGISGTITDVNLKLTEAENWGNGTTGTARAYASPHTNWDEDTLDGNNLPGTGSQVGILNGEWELGKIHTIDVDMLVNGNGQVTVILKHDAGGYGAAFHAKENTAPPILEVITIPSVSAVTASPIDSSGQYAAVNMNKSMHLPMIAR